MPDAYPRSWGGTVCEIGVAVAQRAHNVRIRVGARLGHGWSSTARRIAGVGGEPVIGPPYFPTTRVRWEVPETGETYAYGGDPRSNMIAGVDSWRQTLDFLEQHL